MNRSRWCCVGIAALVFMAGLGALAEPCTITVQPGESIQTAINSAPAGAVICLAAGTWHENISIRNSLTLRGAGSDKTRIRGVSAETEGAVVIIHGYRSPEVQIERLAVVEGQAKRTGYPFYTLIAPSQGIGVKGGAKVTILDVVIQKNSYGVYIATDAAKVTVRGSTFLDNRHGIVVQGSSEVEISGSTIRSGSAIGIEIFSYTGSTPAYAVIQDSSVSGYDLWGILIHGNAQASIEDSTVSENGGMLGVGIGVSQFAQATIQNSSVLDNKDYGIQVSDEAHVTIEGCVIAGNSRYGVLLYTPPCIYTTTPSLYVFEGYVAGRANVIPGPGEPNANRQASVCPDTLRFLTTDQGGELDLRWGR